MLSPALLRRALAAALLLAAAGPAAGQQPLTEAEAEKARKLVEQLGAADYRTREQAAGQLVRLGPAAEPVLRAGMNHADAEVRARCRRLLPQALGYDMERRLQAFLDGKEDKERPAPPGWARFKALVGDDARTRELFAAMFRYDRDFLTALDRRPASVKERMDARCLELVASLNQISGRSIPPEQLGLLLFASLEPRLRLDPQAQSNLASALYSLSDRSRNKRLVQHNAALRKLLLKYAADDTRHSDGMALAIVANFELSESVDIARAYLKKIDQDPNTRGMAILVLGRFGDRQVIPELLPLLADKESIGEANFNNTLVRTQVRDIVLAALVHLTGQSHADYGFAIARHFPAGMPFGGLTTSVWFGFSDDAARDAALKRWGTWYEKNKARLSAK